jgi:predicted dehydrogenase
MRGKLSRREFIRTTAGAAGATVVGPRILLEPPTLAASPRPVPPSDRVRFGIIGIGMQGVGLMRTSLRLPGVECVAACDLYDGRHDLAREVAGDRKIITTRRYQELLENKEIDCIINATPDHWHRQIVLDCCAAGKSVYCEKPMTHSVAEGFEMVAASAKTKTLVMVGSQRSTSLLTNKAKELMAAGAIGEVSLIESSMGRNDPTGAWQYPPPPDLSPQNLDWETWLGPAPKIPFNPVHFARWRCWQAYGSGVAGDLFVHLLTGIHHATGYNAPPRRALSTGGIYRFRDGRDVPDVHATLFDYPNFEVMMRVTQTTESDDVTRFMGSRGILEMSGRRLVYFPQPGVDLAPSYYANAFPKALREEYFRKWNEEHGPRAGQQRAVEATTYETPSGYDVTREHLWVFYQAVKEKEPVVQDAAFGNHTSIACHMANHSYFKKTVATWDAPTRTIQG